MSPDFDLLADWILARLANAKPAESHDVLRDYLISIYHFGLNNGAL